jgi:hypothetical protein
MLYNADVHYCVPAVQKYTAVYSDGVRYYGGVACTVS